jgi:hypothetical protein
MKNTAFIRIPLFFSLLFFSFFSNAQALEWYHTYGLDFASAVSVSRVSDSTIAVIGNYAGNTGFDPGPGTDMHAGNVGWDYSVVQKLDLNGNVLKTVSFGGLKPHNNRGWWLRSLW